jgi:hypothetical protein
MAMQDYLVTLPDGSEGTLELFYQSILDNSITITDEGYVLEDGTLLETNGEPAMGMTEEELLVILAPYISEISYDEAGDGLDYVPEEEVLVEPVKDNKVFLYLVLGLIAYMVIKK